MKRISLFFAIVLFAMAGVTRADEGMWLPLLVKQLNIDDMRAKGFKLTAEELYSVNGSSLKDAVVQFGGGCTGAMVSAEGLLLTNHHCAYGNIQSLSSVENDYLTHGYCAMNRAEELPCPGLTVNFLEYMEDVTSQVLEGVAGGDDEATRKGKIDANISALTRAKKASRPELTYEVEPMYFGNQYFLFAYLTYRDVRLVVAPPSSVGKFGGDTDNWMWPRHTGDFTMLRVYAGADNMPAAWSDSNVPFRPKKHFNISTAGVSPDDFAMVFGYPGSTDRYVVSQAVNEVMAYANPRKVALRDERLAVMDRFMSANDTIRIKYASKHASVANAWKKWRGEANGLQRLDAVGQKRAQEREFQSWSESNSQRKAMYGTLLAQFEETYRALAPLELANDFYNQGLRGIESLNFALAVVRLAGTWGKEGTLSDSDKSSAQRRRELFFKNYDSRVDAELMASMLSAYMAGVPAELQLPAMRARFASNEAIVNFVEGVFRTSVLTDDSRFSAWIQEGSMANLHADPLFAFARELRREYDSLVSTPRYELNAKLAPLYRVYVKGLREKDPDARYFPDANFTLRIAYGKVEGYEAREAVQYGHQTTLDGVVEKVAMGAHDYVMPDKLRQLYDKKDYGRWAVNGSVPVCFAGSIHTTGGNSGSPALNAKGELIGLNFDRVWEGTMSDIMFDPAKCRNIMVDIRYVLFLIDKYAGASYLLNEMNLVK